jgi:carboxymethylenebutenolidase
MGQFIDLTAADGHKLKAYRADPAGAPKGALVVIQEIFGVNHHMRGVADGYAKDGYAVIAPALFDRVTRDVELGYQPDDIAKGREIRMKITYDQVLADVSAAAAAMKDKGKLGIIGYCWGGSVIWVAATKLDGFAAAIGYYGGDVAKFASDTPRCPIQLHFGDKDTGIPMSDVAKVQEAQKDNIAKGKVEVHVYPAGHGFNCDERGSYDKASATQARERALAFFKKYVG